MEQPPLDMNRVRELLAAVRENHATPEQFAELDALVQAYPEVRQHVAHSMYLHAALLWRGANLADDRSTAEKLKTAAAPLLGHLGNVLQQGWNAVSHPTQRPLMAAGLAALAAAVVLAVIVAPSWFRAQPQWEAGVVARLNRVDKVIWPANQALLPGARLFAGDRLQIDRGLMELSFYSGARVIVEGPAVIEASARDSCRLLRGAVTALVPPQAVGFRVESPQITVIDLGTQFGIRRKRNETEVQVFEGTVEAVATPATTKQSLLTMTAGEAVIFKGRNFVRVDALAQKFVCRMPEVESPAVWGTGQGLQPGQVDPHWQVSAVSCKPNFRPQQAAVAQGLRTYLPADPQRGNWISLQSDLPPVTGKCYYTFSTQIDLTRFDPSSARLWGMFSADNQVHEIRINGQPVAVPPHPTGGFTERYNFLVDQGFRPGLNRLEFVVYNVEDPSQMALLVELHAEAEKRKAKNW